MKYVSSWLIANNLKVKFGTRFQISLGLVFRRAFKYETEKYRRILQQFGTSNLGWIPPFELDWVSQGGGGSGHTCSWITDHENWKYWVISDSVGGTEGYQLQRILNIMEPELDLSIRLMFQFDKGKRSSGGYSPAHHHIGEKHWGMTQRKMKPDTLTTFDLEEYKILFHRFKHLSENEKFIRNAFTKFHDLQSVPRNSDLRTVGYFSIIEGLVTHSPRLNESLDSISHQLRGKMVLLSRRIKGSTPKPESFKQIEEKKLWTKLYKYRSMIAHGDIPDFDNEFQILEKRETVNAYLHDVCKTLLKFALRESVFLSDLKEC